eukprot:CAMPEP_0172745168 /NCGR_PEP_ID=MMETSP1074-20121228/137231_1 /TAXON_ID=2916 /ORGANISM="Ceratium fusus, Strain PA161109" /LENGTH=76 /DNA_ID=CAMNT_0013576275 /DNA_START=32 /DNA_END=259 /DNA_ORIENTATION=-
MAPTREASAWGLPCAVGMCSPGAGAPELSSKTSSKGVSERLGRMWRDVLLLPSAFLAACHICPLLVTCTACIPLAA